MDCNTGGQQSYKRPCKIVAIPKYRYFLFIAGRELCLEHMSDCDGESAEANIASHFNLS